MKLKRGLNSGNAFFHFRILYLYKSYQKVKKLECITLQLYMFYACATLCTTENGTWMEDVCKVMREGQGLKIF